MKIAIASDDGTTIAAHFGRTRGFSIYAIENGAIQYIGYRNNTFTGHARGLAGQLHDIDRHGPIIAALKDCDLVISHGMGRRIYDDLQRAGIDAYIVNETVVDTAAKLYFTDNLKNHPQAACNHSDA